MKGDGLTAIKSGFVLERQKKLGVGQKKVQVI
jgi:hypothetical protein